MDAKKEQRNITGLLDNIFSIQEITCSNCRIFCNSLADDPQDAAKEFQELGWRHTRFGNDYCPRCAKKKLKE
jgi:hypothetical protein